MAYYIYGSLLEQSVFYELSGFVFFKRTLLLYDTWNTIDIFYHFGISLVFIIGKNTLKLYHITSFFFLIEGGKKKKQTKKERSSMFETIEQRMICHGGIYGGLRPHFHECRSLVSLRHAFANRCSRSLPFLCCTGAHEVA